jgi:hypothetical protein
VAHFLGYILTVDLIESNKKLSEFLLPSQSLLSSRLGSLESQILESFSPSSEALNLRLRKNAWLIAGVFPPTTGQLKSFSDLYREAILNTDLFAIWPQGIQEPHDRLISKYASTAPKINMSVLDVLYCAGSLSPSDIWISKLSGKRVLVIHPFTESFKHQYANLKNLHKIPILPEFEATFSRPPMTQGLNIFSGTYSSNLALYLENLRAIILDKKYDYALVAAGAYGLPISKVLKENSITTVYMGGALQLLFGVFGARWKNRIDINSFRTAQWLEHPLEAPPRGASFIEGKSYW